jgi:hypothetical protein
MAAWTNTANRKCVSGKSLGPPREFFQNLPHSKKKSRADAAAPSQNRRSGIQTAMRSAIRSEALSLGVEGRIPDAAPGVFPDVMS